MKIEQPSSGEDLPKLFRAEEGEDHEITLPVQDLAIVKNDKDWDCYNPIDLDVVDSEDQEVEGTNEVPFYEMKAFAAACMDYLDHKPKSKIIRLTYSKKEKGGKTIGTWKRA